jgi:hypothetical protein
MSQENENTENELELSEDLQFLKETYTYENMLKNHGVWVHSEPGEGPNRFGVMYGGAAIRLFDTLAQALLHADLCVAADEIAGFY